MNFIKDMSSAQACVIGLVIAALLYLFYFGGMSKDKMSSKLSQQKLQLIQKSKDTDTMILEVKAHKERLDNFGNTINKVIKYIPKDMSSSKLMRSLADSAKIAGVNIIGVSENGSSRSTRRTRRSGTIKKNEPLYDEVPVNIRLEGNFNQIMVFLSKLTELDNIITMKDFNIKSKSGLGGSSLISFMATFVGYKYRVVEEGEAN